MGWVRTDRGYRNGTGVDRTAGEESQTVILSRRQSLANACAAAFAAARLPASSTRAEPGATFGQRAFARCLRDPRAAIMVQWGMAGLSVRYCLERVENAAG